ncbi:MAG: DNA repair protein RadC [Hyphomonadaceae bacterium]|nr:DNA repair protein RadC [Clostridia bacterium]
MNELHKGHRQRVKARFLKEGLDHYEDHQILEFLLFFAIPQRDTNEIAHKLIAHFGSLSKVFEAEHSEILKIDSVGEHAATLLTLIPQLSRRYTKDRWGERVLVNSVDTAGEYIKTLFLGRKYEVFYLICLDAQNQVIFPALVHEGTINEAPIYPRLIVETALRHHTHSVILAHNHPSGSSKPSKADIEVTHKIIQALQGIDIAVIDHIIIAGNEYSSLAQLNLLRK